MIFKNFKSFINYKILVYLILFLFIGTFGFSQNLYAKSHKSHKSSQIKYSKKSKKTSNSINLSKSNKYDKKNKQDLKKSKKSKNKKYKGKGGSAPEDLDAKIEILDKYNVTKDLKKSKKSKKYATIPSMSPADGEITSNFGKRTSPFSGNTEFHKGIDIANRIGTPIAATANGVIIEAGRHGGSGNVIVIDHGNGITTRYCHMSKIIKKLGSKVKKGQIIGLMGNTGKSTGPHVHYEIYKNGVLINPETTMR